MTKLCQLGSTSISSSNWAGIGGGCPEVLGQMKPTWGSGTEHIWLCHPGLLELAFVCGLGVPCSMTYWETLGWSNETERFAPGTLHKATPLRLQWPGCTSGIAGGHLTWGGYVGNDRGWDGCSSMKVFRSIVAVCHRDCYRSPLFKAVWPLWHDEGWILMMHVL